jgi:hypothetical protein
LYLIIAAGDVDFHRKFAIGVTKQGHNQVTDLHDSGRSLLVNSGNRVPLPFGASAGDMSLGANDDGSTDAVTLPRAMNFFDRTYSQLYFNNNGDLTFSSPYSGFTPSLFTQASSIPMVAPWFADVDTRGAASDSPARLLWYRVSTQASDVQLAKAELSLPDSVVVNYVVVATWNKVGYYSGGHDKLNTFQASIQGKLHQVFN